VCNIGLPLGRRHGNRDTLQSARYFIDVDDNQHEQNAPVLCAVSAAFDQVHLGLYVSLARDTRIILANQGLCVNTRAGYLYFFHNSYATIALAILMGSREKHMTRTNYFQPQELTALLILPATHAKSSHSPRSLFHTTTLYGTCA
jgi:hypothetical protein